MQIFKKQSKSKKTNDSELREMLESIEKVKEPQTRIVTLVAESCCGCGCTEFNIQREVPIDSHLQDGDYIGSALEENDIIL